jgi:hypothetical protein
VALSIQWAYGRLMAALLHPTYLPFTVDQLRGHFAPVLGTGELDRHLTYYLASLEQAKVHADLVRRGVNPTPAQTRLGRQLEKDERFWLATALMSLYHQDGGSGRGERFGRLLERAGLCPPSSFDGWAAALAGPLELFFEVNLPSPPSYRAWLRDHLDERVPIPYLREKAEASGSRLEGATKADAMLVARGTGSTAGSCPHTRIGMARSSSSTCPTALARNWLKSLNDWDGPAGRIATPWSQVRARGLQSTLEYMRMRSSELPLPPSFRRPQGGMSGCSVLG